MDPTGRYALGDLLVDIADVYNNAQQAIEGVEIVEGIKKLFEEGRQARQACEVPSNDALAGARGGDTTLWRGHCAAETFEQGQAAKDLAKASPVMPDPSNALPVEEAASLTSFCLILIESLLE